MQKPGCPAGLLQWTLLVHLPELCLTSGLMEPGRMAGSEVLTPDWPALAACCDSAAATTSSVLNSTINSPSSVVEMPMTSSIFRTWYLMNSPACSSTKTRRVSMPLAHDCSVNSQLFPS